MEETPFFTVLVPVYNQAQFLGEALDTLIAQTDPDWEAIVVNDGSTDDTPEVIQTYTEKDRRFRAIHKENGGVGSALNAGLQKARGQWICWLSSDDLFDIRKLAIHREWISRYPDCRLFYTHFRYLHHATGKLVEPWLRTISDKEWQLLEMLRLNYIHGNSICVQREAWARAGTFDEGLRYGQDYDMWLRLLALYPATFIPHRTCVTRLHELQTTRTFPKACHFDSAKAAINFINEHSFADIVPLVDFSDPKMASRAINKALDIAADASGFVYMLGPHPALLLRIMEWAWTYAQPDTAGRAQKTIRQRVSEISCRYSGTPFGFMWRAAASASRLPQRRFDYQKISPVNTAEMNYWFLKFIDITEAQQIQEYLERFNVTIIGEESVIPEVKTREVAIVCREEMSLTSSTGDDTVQSAIIFARQLMRSGCPVLITGLSTQGIGFLDGVLYVGAGDEKSLSNAIKFLGPLYMIAGISRPDISRIGCARKYINLTIGEQQSGTPESAHTDYWWRQPGADFFNTMESLSINTSRTRIFFCSIFRRGQIKGLSHRIAQDHIGQSRIAIAIKIVWRKIGKSPVHQWPRLFKELWSERRDRRG
jgi:glycosyltransferase involved in cell wall biosynthesis